MKKVELATETKETSGKDLEVFSILSHEIRTPLNAIIGISNLLQKEESRPYREEYYRILKSTSENLLELVNNVLDYSKLNSGYLENSSRNFEFKKKVEDSLHSQKLLAMSKGLEFVLDFDPKIPSVVKGDQVKICQIFINLISNAVKFTEKGKVLVRFSLKEESSTSLVVESTVTDTGIGIPSEQIDKIFDAFHQGEDSINIKYAGSGLGLNIIQNLITMLKGSLEVESELGSGTSFTVLLPFEKTLGENTTDQFEGTSEFGSLKGKRVLLAEDNKVNQLVISRFLELWEIQYVVVENGKEALVEIRKNEFDVVLLDIHMPIMNGFETIERIRSFEQFQKLPVIALTAAADDKETRKFLTSRFTNFLPKPFEERKLMEFLMVYSSTTSK